MVRTRNLYDPASEKPYKLSRSKVDLFLNCRRCFYIDRRLGISQPGGYPFNLNIAVDHLLKKEFDHYRENQQPHPYLIENNIRAIPFQHPDLNIWRENFKGVTYIDPKSNFHLTGAVDDVWQSTDDGSLIVADYKATSKNGQVSIDADWQISYKRQMEFYQWLLRKNDFDVSDTGYFVYCNGIKSNDRFDNKLEFDVSLIPYTGSDSWVGETINNIFDTLEADIIPESSDSCDYCGYTNDLRTV
jgi:hypothetical protein